VKCFNPRAREERDDFVERLEQLTQEFQSTRP
jgi:hypothetical protein